MTHKFNKIGTHDGAFHADECMAVAILRRSNPNLNVTRTRDSKELEGLDARVDVGFEYNPNENNYDHHQKEGAGKRENNVYYASAGLIWKHFGKDYIQNEDAWKYVDRKLIQAIDSEDNGIRPTRDIPYFTIGEVIKSYNNKDGGFEDAVRLSGDLLDSTIAQGDMYVTHKNKIKKAETLFDGDVIATDTDLDELETWQFYVVPETNTKYVISPSKNGLWKVRSVPTEIEGFESRAPFPKEWRGRSKEDLESVTGVEGSEFCHKAGFLIVSKDRSGAIKLAEKAISHK